MGSGRVRGAFLFYGFAVILPCIGSGLGCGGRIPGESLNLSSIPSKGAPGSTFRIMGIESEDGPGGYTVLSGSIPFPVIQEEAEGLTVLVPLIEAGTRYLSISDGDGHQVGAVEFSVEALRIDETVPANEYRDLIAGFAAFLSEYVAASAALLSTEETERNYLNGMVSFLDALHQDLHLTWARAGDLGNEERLLLNGLLKETGGAGLLPAELNWTDRPSQAFRRSHARSIGAKDTAAAVALGTTDTLSATLTAIETATTLCGIAASVSIVVSEGASSPVAGPVALDCFVISEAAGWVDAFIDSFLPTDLETITIKGMSPHDGKKLNPGEKARLDLELTFYSQNTGEDFLLKIGTSKLGEIGGKELLKQLPKQLADKIGKVGKKSVEESLGSTIDILSQIGLQLRVNEKSRNNRQGPVVVRPPLNAVPGYTSVTLRSLIRDGFKAFATLVAGPGGYLAGELTADRVIEVFKKAGVNVDKQLLPPVETSTAGVVEVWNAGTNEWKARAAGETLVRIRGYRFDPWVFGLLEGPKAVRSDHFRVRVENGRN